MIRFELNGKPAEFEPRGDEAAVDLLRGAGLTGTKLVCGSGACGACTIHLENKAVVSCCLPAHSLEGRSVRTIEGYPPEDLHPIQRAFMACDGLQCGFCTPGFVMAAIAFYESWRSRRGLEEPSRQEIAEGLAGNLCRCGAYLGIYQAVARACRGDFEEKTEVESCRVDALEKVTGRARYTVDQQLEGQLVGKILRATYGHGRVARLDLSKARQMEGVRAAVELLAKDKTVRHVGQELAAVAAVDEATAQAALAAIEVELERLPLTLGIDQARRPDSEPVWKEGNRRPANAGEGVVAPGRWRGNIKEPYFALGGVQPGKAEAAAEKPGPKVEGVWKCAGQIHTTLEPHAALARWHSDGSLLVFLSTQACHSGRQKIAERYGLSLRQVEVRCAYVGGGFGAKLGITAEALAAIELAKRAGAPVMVSYDRPEEMTNGGYRPPVDVELTLASDERGDWRGLKALAYNDSGNAVSALTTFQMGNIYTKGKLPRKLCDLDVLTHVAPGKPFRGPGAPIGCFSLEGAIDQLAHQLGKDPIALRRGWDDDPIRGGVFDWVESQPAWSQRGPVAAEKGRFRRGVGVALACWSYFYDPLAQVKVTVDEQGITVATASQDMGNGTYTLLAQAAAEVLQVSPLDIRVKLGSSRAVPGPTSGGSRCANSLYQPTRVACKKVVKAFQDAVKIRWQDAPINQARGGLEINSELHSWERLVGEVGPQTGHEKRGTDRCIEQVAQYVLRWLGMDIVIGKGASNGAYLTEVEVDTLLGKVRPLRVWGVMGVGKVFVPELARSQCYGGIIQGLGYALYEEKLLDPATGLVLTANLEDYRLPGLGDTPEMVIDFLEQGFEHARGGGVGLAELSTLPVAASVANAIFHATGWRPRQLPVTPQRLLEALR